MKILVAVDGSPYTKRMLAYLAAHDEWLGAHHAYTIVTVTPAVPPRAAAVLDKALLKSYYAEGADKIFKPIRTFFEKQKLKAEFVSQVGHAAEIIADMAEKGSFDLVMMGSHGHSNLGNLMAGSVATRVLASCHTPLLLIR